MKGRLAAARERRTHGAARHDRGDELGVADLLALAPDCEVDALGTFCPEPVIRTQERAAAMQPGEVLVLFADDAGVEVDIPAWCISTRNQYLGVIKESRRYRVYVRRGPRPGGAPAPPSRRSLVTE